MKVLVLHNFYQQPGGEDEVFAAECRLLQDHGHEVIRFVRSNDEIVGMGRLEIATRTVWNRSTEKDLEELLRRERPQVAHFHNTFPLISPSCYHAAVRTGVPVVQTLHNYRLLCSNAILFRDGHVCEDCVGKSIPWPGVAHACYRGERLASGVVFSMLMTHRWIGTWRNAIDRYIALTEFARREFIRGGLPADRVMVKPNMLHPDPGVGAGDGEFVLYVGRLSPEKGVRTLLRAWRDMTGSPALKIVGDGPMAQEVGRAGRELPRVEWLGRQSADVTLDLMGRAQCLVVPSEWFEGFPRVVVEALARGTPLIAANIGALAEIVDHGRTGLLFPAGDARALAQAVKRMEPEATRMRAAARREFEVKYAAGPNYETLLAVYRAAGAVE